MPSGASSCNGRTRLKSRAAHQTRRLPDVRNLIILVQKYSYSKVGLPDQICHKYVSKRLLTMIGRHKWQGWQCEKLSRWVPKVPPCFPLTLVLINLRAFQACSLLLIYRFFSLEAKKKQLSLSFAGTFLYLFMDKIKYCCEQDRGYFYTKVEQYK